MDITEHIANYNSIKIEQDLKEFIFMTKSGYRHFFILGKDLKNAEENFLKTDEIKRNGFTLEELPIRLEYSEEKCKDWSVTDFWENNENKIS